MVDLNTTFASVISAEGKRHDPDDVRAYLAVARVSDTEFTIISDTLIPEGAKIPMENMEPIGGGILRYQPK